jgi:hypothetical protein
MGILLFLMLAAALVLGVMYVLQFKIDLDGDKEKVIKDGLITELLKNPQTHIKDNNVVIGRIEIKESIYGGIWFPYQVSKRALTFEERHYLNEDPYSSTVGFIMLWSKDYFTVRKMFKQIKSKQNIEQNQKQKLGL